MMQKEDCGGRWRNDVLEKWKGKWDPSTSGGLALERSQMCLPAQQVWKSDLQVGCWTIRWQDEGFLIWVLLF